MSLGRVQAAFSEGDSLVHTTEPIFSRDAGTAVHGGLGVVVPRTVRVTARGDVIPWRLLEYLRLRVEDLASRGARSVLALTGNSPSVRTGLTPAALPFVATVPRGLCRAAGHGRRGRGPDPTVRSCAAERVRFEWRTPAARRDLLKTGSAVHTGLGPA